MIYIKKNFFIFRDNKMLLKPLTIFTTIVKLGGFSKAAQALGTSTSSITRLLSQLENELGFALLERTTRTIRLTEAGSLFYEKAQEILSIYDMSKKHLGLLQNVLSGQIKIGAPSSLSYLYITKCINEFLEQYPHVNVQLVNGDHLLDLLENDFDFIFHCRPLPDSSFQYRKLGAWTRMLCAAPSYIKKNGQPNSLEALSTHNCLMHYQDKTSSWPFIVNKKIKNISVTGNIVTDSSLNLLNLTLNGIGIAYLPSFVILPELKKGKLIQILPEHQLPSQEIYAVFSKNRYRIKKVRVLLDFLTQKIQQQ